MNNTIDCKVITLSTKNPSKVAKINYNNHIAPWPPNGYWYLETAKDTTPLYLYFTSITRKIKKGDWYAQGDANGGDETLCFGVFQYNGGEEPRGYAIVIATTNLSLGLPSIPEEWIKNKYVPSNGKITDVKIEAGYLIIETSRRITETDILKPKLIANNEVCILNEEKNIVYAEKKWTDKDMLSFGKYVAIHNNNSHMQGYLDDWRKSN